MSQVRVTAFAPSNIALIKYMGKTDPLLNLPENPSLSLTLKALCTGVELTLDPSSQGGIQWIPEIPRLGEQKGFRVPDLSETGLKRMVAHFERLLPLLSNEIYPKYDLSARYQSLHEGRFYLKTANTFPSSSGIASSASSFAAMTLAAAKIFCNQPEKVQGLWERDLTFKRELAALSRQGSGSSCRSFEGPWVYWEGDRAAAIEGVVFPKLAHFVILIETAQKSVSSSQAHIRVRSSPLWEGRVARATARAARMTSALKNADQKTVSKLSWDEAWEMHSLFHTSNEPFSYWRGGTLDGLHWFSSQMQCGSPPIVTLDAGPNIHVLVDQNVREEWRARLEERFGDHSLLEDEGGTGPVLL